MELFVGQKIWWFNPNRRVYARDANGHPFGSPLWREHWQLVEITGETKRCWVLARGQKIPKGELPSGYALHRSDIVRQSYIEEHKYRIVDRIRDLHDPDVLMRIAQLIGYEPSCPIND